MAKTTNGMGYGKGQSATSARQTMGDSIYHDKVDMPSASEFRAGMLTHKEGFGKSGDPAAGGTSVKKQVPQDSLGARYAVQITHRPGFVENASTTASGRIVPPATSSRGAFDAR